MGSGRVETYRVKRVLVWWKAEELTREERVWSLDVGERERRTFRCYVTLLDERTTTGRGPTLRNLCLRPEVSGNVKIVGSLWNCVGPPTHVRVTHSLTEVEEPVSSGFFSTRVRDPELFREPPKVPGPVSRVLIVPQVDTPPPEVPTPILPER